MYDKQFLKEIPINLMFSLTLKRKFETDKNLFVPIFHSVKTNVQIILYFK